MAKRSGRRRARWRRPCITRKQQMERGLWLLRNAGAAKEREAAMKRNLEAALADMAEAHADYEEYKKVKRPVEDRRRVVAALERARAFSEAPLTLKIDGLIEEASRERKWAMSVGKDYIRGLSGRHPADVAVELAVRLLRVHGVPRRRKGREQLAAILPATTRTAAWCKLSAILYGDPKANLFARVQKAAKKLREQLRYFVKQKKPPSNI